MREQFDHQVRSVSDYVEVQARGETVEHAERMLSTKVMGSDHEVWDVRTDADRYWVVTNPTNLYSQEEFKSADYALSFHLGITLRMMDRSRVDIDEDVQDEVHIAWRKYEQAVDAFRGADEAEAYQAVGGRCREALIALGRKIAGDVPEDELSERPKASNFKAWADLGADRFASGRLRSYLKTMADKAWDLTASLTHYDEATPWDADLVLTATAHTISMYGLAIRRHEEGAPARCPRCASYRVESDGSLTDDPDVQWTEQVCGACEHRWDHRYIRLEPGRGWVTTEPPAGAS